MQIEMFRVFAALAETASFSRAAEIVGITQSAVSQQVRAIEKRFDITLIERGRRHLTLTAEGRVFLDATREILKATDTLERRLLRMRQMVVGPLRIATVYSIGLHELPPYLKEYRKQFPDVEVLVDYLRSAGVYHAVAEGEAEIGLVAYPVRRRGLDVLSFWRDRLVLICAPSHRFAQKLKIGLPELNGEKFIAFDPDLPTRKEIDRRLREANVKVRHAMEFDNIETLKRAVEIENGISIVPETTVRNEVRSGQLEAIEIDAPEMWRPIGALVKKRRQGPSASRHFLDLLHKIELGGLLRPVHKRGLE